MGYGTNIQQRQRRYKLLKNNKCPPGEEVGISESSLSDLKGTLHE
jgi:hypothetical protein